MSNFKLSCLAIQSREGAQRKVAKSTESSAVNEYLTVPRNGILSEGKRHEVIRVGTINGKPGVPVLVQLISAQQKQFALGAWGGERGAQLHMYRHTEIYTQKT
jgi:hypothetical protein